MAEVIALMIEDIEEEHAKNPGKIVELTVQGLPKPCSWRVIEGA